MDILQRIEDIRKSKNLSIYELAEKSGIARNTIYRWYSKNYYPNLDTLQILCEKGFNISLAEFFALDDNIANITPEIKELLKLWTTLTDKQKQAILQIMHSYSNK